MGEGVGTLHGKGKWGADMRVLHDLCKWRDGFKHERKDMVRWCELKTSWAVRCSSSLELSFGLEL